MKGIWKFERLLSTVDDEHRITLGEGDTPLLRSKNIGASLGLKNLYFKLENLNPTGSYKDRFAAMAVGHSRRQGKQIVLATSSGNTGAALAAYAGAAGLTCLITLVDGSPFGKVQQMGVYGAELLMIRGFGLIDQVTTAVMHELERLAATGRASLEISAYRFSPDGMEGVQTIAFEIAEALPEVNRVFIPAGGGGLYLSMLLGFSRWKTNENTRINPMLYCVQPEGNDTIASVLAGNKTVSEPLPQSDTSISGLQVPTLLDAQAIYDHALEFPCNGTVVADQDVYYYQKLLARQEGVFCEPAGAVALAGLKKALDRNEIQPDDTIVCLVTGNGPKDVQALDQIYKQTDCTYIHNWQETASVIQKQLMI